jgi:hypothetical protein
VAAVAQNDPVGRLEELGFEIINITGDMLTCRLDPICPEPDDGGWIDLSINEEQCRALHRLGTIVFVKVEGIAGTIPRRIDEKPHLRIELRRYAYR